MEALSWNEVLRASLTSTPRANRAIDALPEKPLFVLTAHLLFDHGSYAERKKVR
jgi:hypothetical protein